MKATLLLATAIFLASAPEPDASIFGEISARFFVFGPTARLSAANDERWSNRFPRDQEDGTPGHARDRSPVFVETTAM